MAPKRAVALLLLMCDIELPKFETSGVQLRFPHPEIIQTSTQDQFRRTGLETIYVIKQLFFSLE